MRLLGCVPSWSAVALFRLRLATGPSPSVGRCFRRFVGRNSSFVKVLGELVNVSALQARLDALASGAGLPFGAAAVVPVPDERRETRLLLLGPPPVEKLEEIRGKFNNFSPGC